MSSAGSACHPKTNKCETEGRGCRQGRGVPARVRSHHLTTHRILDVALEMPDHQAWAVGGGRRGGGDQRHQSLSWATTKQKAPQYAVHASRAGRVDGWMSRTWNLNRRHERPKVDRHQEVHTTVPAQPTHTATIPHRYDTAATTNALRRHTTHHHTATAHRMPHAAAAAATAATHSLPDHRMTGLVPNASASSAQFGTEVGLLFFGGGGLGYLQVEL